MAITMVILSSVATLPEGWEQLGQWTGSIQLVGGVPWAYAHVLSVHGVMQFPVGFGPRLDAGQRDRLFRETWAHSTEEQLRADLALLFRSPVVVEDPRDVAVLRADSKPPPAPSGQTYTDDELRAALRRQFRQPAEGAQSEDPVVLVGHVRQALERALTFTGPRAIDEQVFGRLPEHERTVDGLARAYLPNLLWLDYDGTRMHEDTLAALRSTRWRHPLYVYERSMAHALLVLIALASGHDPGLYGLSVQLDRVDDPGDDEEKVACAGWFLYTPTGGLHWFDDDENDQAACAIAAELDPVRASVLALLHVLAAKAGEAEATS